jgi:hypothetical protein
LSRASTPRNQGVGFSSILAEEGAEHLAPVIESIYRQESGAGANARTSIDGAQGGMQIMPATFRRYAKPGERIDNPDDNMRVGVRIIKDLGKRFGNDPARIAAGYFSGEGNVNPGPGAAWKTDHTDGNGKRVSGYVADVLSRMRTTNTRAPQPNVPARPDLSKAPKWSDIITSPEFAALSPEEKQQGKAAYFDYWMAPHAGDRVNEQRQAFMAMPIIPERGWGEAALDTVVQLEEGINNIIGAIPNLVAPEGSWAQFHNDAAKYWRDKQSVPLRAKVAQADHAINEAGKEGVWAQGKEAASQYWDDPALASRFVFTNAPSVIPGVGAAKAAQAAALARGATAAKAAGAALTASAATGGVLNAGGARGEAFEDIKQTLIRQGMSPEKAEQQALKDSIPVALVGGGIGVLSGGRLGGLESSLFGQAAKQGAIRAGVTATGKELLTEQLEEVIPKFATNLQASRYDGRSFGQDIGRTVVETGIGAGPGAMVAGGVSAIRAGGPDANEAPSATPPNGLTPEPDGRIEPTLGGFAAQPEPADQPDTPAGAPSPQAPPPPPPEAAPSAEMATAGPAFSPTPPPPAEATGAPATGAPFVETADAIVRELALEAGIPLETVLPTNTAAQPGTNAAPDSDQVNDQDVLEFAEGRYLQLLAKRDGQLETVIGEQGATEVNIPGPGLTPGERQELEFLEQAQGNAAALRALYGVNQQAEALPATEAEREAQLEREAIQAENVPLANAQQAYTDMPLPDEIATTPDSPAQIPLNQFFAPPTQTKGATATQRGAAGGAADTQAQVQPEAQRPAQRRLKHDAKMAADANPVADDLRAMAQDAGWAEEGGRAIRGNGPDGPVTGRTHWIARAPWFMAGMEGNPETLRRHIDDLMAGRGIPVKSRRTIDGMMDYLARQIAETGVDPDGSIGEWARHEWARHEWATNRQASGFASDIEDTFGGIAEESLGAIEFLDEASELVQDERSQAQGLRALGFNEDEIHDLLQGTGRNAQERASGSGKNDAGTTQSVSSDGAQAVRTQTRKEGEGTGSGRSGQEDFQLTRQTEAEARADAARRQNDDDLTKEQIDREREAFTLSGQSQPRPQGMAQDLFTADGRPTVAASQGKETGTSKSANSRKARNVKQGDEHVNVSAFSFTDLGIAGQEVARQLVALNRFTDEQIRAYATLIDGFYKTLSGRIGKTVEELWKWFPLDVRTGMDAEGYAQSAFHGSPYRFDRFTLDHMGEGEGNQAFGWGLYFAGDRALAEHYRKSLSLRRNRNGTFIVDGEEVKVGTNGIWTGKTSGKVYTPLKGDAAAIALNALWEKVGNRQAAIDILLQSVRNAQFMNDKESFQEAARLIEDGRIEHRQDKGQLYNVDIPEDSDLLDYDKTLTEQPEKVRNQIARIAARVSLRLSKAVNKNSNFTTWTGHDFYNEISRELGGDKAASEFLNSLGIPGLRYLDGNSRAKGEGTRNYVIWDESAINVLETFYQRRGDDARGSFNPATLSIRLSESADLSTFLHESGHFFLDMYEKILTNVPATVPLVSSGLSLMRGDFNSLLRWAGYGGGFQSFQNAPPYTRREVHEKFARGFEAYLREGKAPNERMKSVFGMFKTWLKAIYKKIADLGVKLTPEVRQAMGRMIAETRMDERNEKPKASNGGQNSKRKTRIDKQKRNHRIINKIMSMTMSGWKNLDATAVEQTLSDAVAEDREALSKAILAERPDLADDVRRVLAGLSQKPDTSKASVSENTQELTLEEAGKIWKNASPDERQSILNRAVLTDTTKTYGATAAWSKLNANVKRKIHKAMADSPRREAGEGKPAYSFSSPVANAETVDGVRASIAKTLGSVAAKRLAASGKLIIHETPDSLPDGFASAVSNSGAKISGIYDPKTGTIHLVAAYIRQGDGAAKVGHEGWHMFLDALRHQDSQAYQAMMTRIERLEGVLSKGLKSGPWLEAANARIPAADRANKETRLNELAAYAIEEYERAPRVAKWVQDFIASIRAALMQYGFNPKNLTAADLSAISRRFLRQQARSVSRNSNKDRSVAQNPEYEAQTFPEGEVLASVDQEELPSFAETERAYGGQAAYERAREAGRTKLNYRQWVQVRTPEFRAWFGDWDILASRAERKAATFEEARAAAKAFQSKPLTNTATGMEATVSRNSLDKMLSEKAVGKSGTPGVHSLAVANLDHLFERAILGWSKPDANGDVNIRAIHRFFAPMALEDGRAVLAKLTVKETIDQSHKNPLYTVEAVEFNEKSPAAQWVGDNASLDGVSPKTIRSVGDIQSLAERVQNFNPDSVSKVTDPATGEPKAEAIGAFSEANDDIRFSVEDFYHGSYEKVINITNEVGTSNWGKFLFFGGKEAASSHGRYLHKLEIDEDEIISARKLPYQENVSDADDVIQQVMKEYDVDEETAWDLVSEEIEPSSLEDEESRWNHDSDGAEERAEKSWRVQGYTALTAKAMGWRGVAVSNEHGTSYMIDMDGIEDKLEFIVPLFSVEQDEPTGHAQPLSAKVLTPSGFKRMGDIHVGDEVITPDGSATQVTNVFPQGKKPIYRVVFNDGSQTRTTADHLWSVRAEGEEDYRTLPLAALMPGVKAGKRYELPEVRG